MEEEQARHAYQGPTQLRSCQQQELPYPGEMLCAAERHSHRPRSDRLAQAEGGCLEMAPWRHEGQDRGQAGLPDGAGGYVCP